MKTTSQKTVSAKKTHPIVSFFSSMKLAIWLLLILALSSIVGTLIPQEGPGVHLHLSPGLLKVFNALQLSDFYHSFLFLSLAGLLGLNLLVCTTRRLPSLVRSVRNASSGGIPANAHRTEINVAGEDTGSTMLKLEGIIRYRYGKVSREESSGGVTLSAQRGRHKRLILSLAHLSILVIIFGMIAGRFTGFDAYVELAEGTSTDRAYLNSNPGVVDLGFTVRCDAFKADFYDNGMPKEFLSELSFLEDGRTVQQGSLMVNHPVSFRGIRFYQSNYRVGYDARLNVVQGSDNESITASAGKEYMLDDQVTRIRILRIEDDFMKMGPAVQLDVSGPDSHGQVWVFKYIQEISSAIPDLFTRAPQFNPGRFAPFVFSLDGLTHHYITGLSVNRDPGGVIVAAGSLAFFLGIFTALLIPRKRIWAECRDGKISITVQPGISPGTPDEEILHILKEVNGELR